MSLQVDRTETNVTLVLKNFRAKFAISMKMKEVNFLDRIFNKITYTFYEKLSMNQYVSTFCQAN